MSSHSNGLAQRRNNPFTRTNSSPQPTSTTPRPKSGLFSPPSNTPSVPTPISHGRTQSNSWLVSTPGLSGTPQRHGRSDSKAGTPASNTFAPSFIKTEEDMRHDHDAVKGIEGENDFSGKRYVWLKDPNDAFVKGWVVDELEGNRILVQTESGAVSCPTSVQFDHYSHIYSNERLIPRALIKSIPPSSTRQTIWPN